MSTLWLQGLSLCCGWYKCFPNLLMDMQHKMCPFNIKFRIILCQLNHLWPTEFLIWRTEPKTNVRCSSLTMVHCSIVPWLFTAVSLSDQLSVYWLPRSLSALHCLSVNINIIKGSCMKVRRSVCVWLAGWSVTELMAGGQNSGICMQSSGSWPVNSEEFLCSRSLSLPLSNGSFSLHMLHIHSHTSWPAFPDGSPCPPFQHAVSYIHYSICAGFGVQCHCKVIFFFPHRMCTEEEKNQRQTLVQKSHLFIWLHRLLSKTKGSMTLQ